MSSSMFSFMKRGDKEADAKDAAPPAETPAVEENAGGEYSFIGVCETSIDINVRIKQIVL
jgi:hypothetical protein